MGPNRGNNIKHYGLFLKQQDNLSKLKNQNSLKLPIKEISQYGKVPQPPYKKGGIPVNPKKL